MSVIEELSIQGIRSFSSFEAMRLEFFKPLTLIVGHNGSGKTTIIECLKYATTGEMPPFSRGGAFINDPKVAGVSEVKAKLQLRFIAVNKQHSILTRVLQLTQKQHKLELATLDAVLRTFDPETQLERSISMKCTALNNELPYQLGVSKAILENVIFCHQEDSNWPLSESSVLKKKFDEIFAATNYTKALDSLKGVSKRLDADIKIQHAELLHYLSKKERGDAILSSFSAAVEAKKRLEKKISSLEAKELVEARNALELASTELGELSALHRSKQTLREDIRTTEEQLVQLDGSFELEEGKSLYELELLLAKSNEERLDKLKEKMSALEGKCKGQDLKASSIVKRKQSLLEEQASWRFKHTEKVTVSRELEAFVRQTVLNSDEAGLDFSKSPLVINPTGEEFWLSPEDVDSFRNVIASATSALQYDITCQEAEFKSKRARLLGELSALKEQADAIKQQMQFEKGEIAAQLGQLEQWKKEKEAMNCDDRQGEILSQKLRALKVQHASWSDKLKQGNADFEQRKVMGQKLEVDAELAAIRKELVESIALAPQVAERQLLQNQLTKCENELQGLQFSENCDSANSLNRKLQERSASLADISAQCSELERLKTAQGLEVSRSEKQIEYWERERLDAEQRLKQKVGDASSWPEVHREALAKVDCEKGKIAEVESSRQLYERFIAKVKEKQSCPVCLRGFHDSGDCEALAVRLEMMVKGFPEELKSCKLQLSVAEAHLNEVNSCGADYEFLKISETQHLGPERLELERKRQNIQETSNQLLISHTRLEEERLNLEILEQKILQNSQATKLKSERESLASQISSIDARLGAGRSLRNVAELEEARKRLEEQLLDIQANEGAAAATLKEMQTQLDAVQGKILQCERDIETIERNCAAREALGERILASQNLVRRKRQNFEVQTAELNSLEQRIEPLEAECHLLDSEHELQLKHNTERQTRIANCSDSFEKKCRQVKGLESLEIEKQLEFAERSLGELDLELEFLEAERLEVSRQRTLLEQATQDLVKNRRELQLNVQYKRLQEELSRKRSNLSEIPELGSLETAEGKVKAARQFVTELELSISGLGGELKQLQTQCDQLDREYQQDYASASRDYDARVIKLRTQEMARKDLGQYAQALDKAIMEYHSLKMQEINKIVHDLWTRTYRGMDIDTVHICSDNEGGSSDSARSYKYRVVMVKGDTELDMRGRCSAGQKVLTSLIIRLALAETFCLKCGILALDEPTTNLDRDNIESLAESLVQILEMRQSHHNFQLIVITHDEDFMQLLGKSQYADSYYRVFKNERGFSVINNEPIGNL